MTNTATETNKRFEVFFSHAFEDKKSIADLLAKELAKRGVNLYYSGFELSVGTSIKGSIGEALKQVDFGLILLSKDFFHKPWAQKELSSLLMLEQAKKLRILALRHEITHDEVLENEPLLADIFSISTDQDIDYVVSELVKIIQEEPAPFIEKSKDKEEFKPNRILSILGTMIPLFALSIILGYMGMINTKASVTADLSASKISFELLEKGILIRSLPFSSFRLSHGELKIWPSNLYKEVDTSFAERDQALTEYSFSSISASGEEGFVLREIYLPAATIVSVQHGTEYLYLSLETSSNTPQNHEDRISGKIGSFGSFDMDLLPISPVLESSELTVKVNIDEHIGDIQFEALNRIELVLSIDSTHLLGKTLLERLSGRDYSFVKIDQTLPSQQEESTIEEARITFTGKNLLGRPFPLKEDPLELESGTFLDFSDKDIYHIKKSTINRENFAFQLYGPSAQELRTGLTTQHMNTIFPSLLDLIVAEPKKETIYTIIAFIMAQFLLIKRNFFPKRPKKEANKEAVLT